MTALMLQTIKQMQEQHVAQEIMQEQQRAADERQRQFFATILERRADQTPAATRSAIEKSPPIKIDFKKFSVIVENQEGDAGRDDQTCLARPNSQTRTGAGKYVFFHVQLVSCRPKHWSLNLDRLTSSLLVLVFRFP